MSFGRVIAEARQKANLSLRDLAARIRKEDGTPVSPQYLNDLEHDRRNPPSDHILQQLADVLDIPRDFLYFQAGEMPPELRSAPADREDVLEAYKAFRKRLQGQRGDEP